MADPVLFVVSPTAVPECKSCIDAARAAGVTVRQIVSDKISEIQSTFGDEFPGVPALFREGRTPRFVLGVEAVLAELRRNQPTGAPPPSASETSSGFLTEEIPGEDVPDRV